MIKKSILKQSLDSFIEFTYPDTHEYQKKLLEKSIKNAAVFPRYPQRPWPFWVTSAHNQTHAPLFQEANHFGLMNSNFRNWTYLNAESSTNKAQIDPQGLIHCHGKSFSVTNWISNSNSLCIPQLNQLESQQFCPQSNSVITTFKISQIQIKTQSFLSEISENNDCIFTQHSIQNTAEKNIKLSFYIAIRPFDLEGISPINDINYLQGNAFMINHKLGLILDQEPDNIICLNHQEGDVSEFINKLEMIVNTKCTYGLASAFAEYKLIIPPNETLYLSHKIPCDNTSFRPRLFSLFNTKQKLQKTLNNFQQKSFKSTLTKQKNKIKKEYKNQTQIQLPNTKLNHFLNIQPSHNIHHLNNLIQHKTIFIESIKALSKFNYSKPIYCETSITYSIRNILKQLKEKKLFYSELSEWFQALLYLQQSKKIVLHQQHYSLLEKILLHGINSLHYIHKKTYKLLPKRYCSKRGELILFLADSLGLILCIKSYHKLRNQKKNTVLKPTVIILKESIQWLINELNKKTFFKNIVPISLTQSIAIESITTTWLYRQVFPEDTERVNTTLLQIQKHLLVKNHIFSLLYPSGYPIKENINYAKLLLTLDPHLSFTSLDSLLKFASSTQCFPDIVHPNTGHGSEGDGHNPTLGLAYAETCLKCLCEEDKTGLNLFQGIPSNWLYDENWHIHNLSTQYGMLSIDVHTNISETTVQITVSNKQSNQHITLFGLHGFSHYTNEKETFSCDKNHITIPFASRKLTFKKHANL